MKSSLFDCKCEECGDSIDFDRLQNDKSVSTLKCEKCTTGEKSCGLVKKNHGLKEGSIEHRVWRLKERVDHKPLSAVMERFTYFLMQPGIREGEHCVDTFKMINCLLLIAYADMEKIVYHLKHERPFDEETGDICEFISKMGQYLLHLESNSLKTSEELRRLMLKYNKIV